MFKPTYSVSNRPARSRSVSTAAIFALGLASGLAAHGGLYTWVNTAPGNTGTNSFRVSANFTVPDAAFADSELKALEVATFSATGIASSFNSMPSASYGSLDSTSDYLLSPTFDIAGGQFRSSTPGTVFGAPATYELVIAPTDWEQTIRYLYNGAPQVIVFRGRGNWVPSDLPSPTPPSVPDGSSTQGAVAMVLVGLGLWRRWVCA